MAKELKHGSYLEKEIRTNWKKGSLVRVYSKTMNKWMDAMILYEFRDKDGGDYLKVVYTGIDDNNPGFTVARDDERIKPYDDKIWVCSVCTLENNTENERCVACETKQA